MRKVAHIGSPEQHHPKEVEMFARHVSIVLKPNSVDEFTRTMKNLIIPLLRKQKGFMDEITLITRAGTKGVGTSCGNRKKNAAGNYRTPYPHGRGRWAKVVKETQKVKSKKVTT